MAVEDRPNKRGKNKMTPEEQVIMDALERQLRVASKKRQECTDIEDAVIGVVSEFLSSFVLFGYTDDGQSIEPIFYAHNQQEADSLANKLGQIFMEMQRPKG